MNTDTSHAALAEALKAIAEFPEPERDNMPAYNMRAIARAALAQAEAAQPVAWVYWHPRDATHDGPVTLYKKAVSRFTDDTRKAMQREGWEFQPLYAAPQPAEAAPKQEL